MLQTVKFSQTLNVINDPISQSNFVSNADDGTIVSQDNGAVISQATGPRE